MSSFHDMLGYVLAVLCPAAVVTIKYALTQFTELGNGKVVVITGASSGIGKACAKAFYAQGCRVVLCSRNVLKLKAVKEELISSNSDRTTVEPSIVPLDVCNQESISEAVEMIQSMFPGGVHILINNAGISFRGDILSTSMEVHRKIMETNYFGHVAVTKGLIPLMMRLPYKKGKPRANILNVNSIQGLISIPHRSAYSASKFACTSFFDCLRAKLSGNGITVCNVFPSYVKTDISNSALRGDGSDYGRLDKNQETGMDTGYVADRILRAVKYNKEEVVISDLTAVLGVWLRFLLPFAYFRNMDGRSKRKLD